MTSVSNIRKVEIDQTQAEVEVRHEEVKAIDKDELYNRMLDNRDALRLLVDKGLVNGKEADDVKALIGELDSVINELA